MIRFISINIIKLFSYSDGGEEYQAKVSKDLFGMARKGEVKEGRPSMMKFSDAVVDDKDQA